MTLAIGCFRNNEGPPQRIYFPYFNYISLSAALTDPGQIIAYEGETATLPPTENKVRKLNRIRWTILENRTLIATYKTGDLNTDHFWMYKGRLSLNTSTGSLQITNVTLKDTMLYSVFLMEDNGKQHKNDVQLRVRGETR